MKIESSSLKKLIILLIFGTVLSCTEKINDTAVDLTPSVDPYISPTGNIGYYYLDGIPVSIEKFANEWNGSQILVHATDNPDDIGTAKLEVRAFHDLSLYFEYGREIGMPLEEFYYMELEIEEYNKEMEVEKFALKYGVPPKGYEEYIVGLQEKYIGFYLDRITNHQKVIALLFRHCDGGTVWPALSQMPFMTVQNNEISAIDRLSIFAWSHVYDKWFYSDKLFSIFHTGYSQQLLLFCPGEPLFFANDRMSSGMFI